VRAGERAGLGINRPGWRGIAGIARLDRQSPSAAFALAKAAAELLQDGAVYRSL
jgi:hypothetical protein